MKLCIAASSGGHLNQLIKLEKIWRHREHFYVTTKSFSLGSLQEKAPCYVVSWANRKHPWLVMRMIFQCLTIIFREKPDVVVSTGAAVGCLLSIFTKFFGGRVIWIDTISHVDRLTLSGNIVRLFADIFLVQWPELADETRNIKYLGSVI
jgi:UDP-N-acetylglucosamine:LPS N-acetylglucosamine transferase